MRDVYTNRNGRDGARGFSSSGKKEINLVRYGIHTRLLSVELVGWLVGWMDGHLHITAPWPRICGRSEHSRLYIKFAHL